MIKKLFLILSLITLVTICFSEKSYADQEEKPFVVSEELIKLNDLYKEGVITEEEFSKAKSILLNPTSSKSEKKKKFVIFKKKKGTTAVERKRLKEAEENKLKAEKEQLRAEKRAERERIRQDILNEEAETERICKADPESKECKSAKQQIKNLLKKLKIIGSESEEARKAREKKEVEKQASLDEQKKIRAEKAKAKRDEKKKRKAEWKKACKEDPKSKACKEGKPAEKIKNVLKKIEKKIGG